MASPQELAELAAEFSGVWVLINGYMGHSQIFPDTRLLGDYCLFATWGMLAYSAFRSLPPSDGCSPDILGISPPIWSRSEVILGEEAHRRNCPLLRQPIHHHYLHDILYAVWSDTCDTGDRTGGLTDLVIMRASLCTYWAGLSRCKSDLKVRCERIHLYFVRSLLETGRTQLVLDMMQYIPAACM